MDTKKEYSISGLGCAHCAMKIEEEIGSLSAVSSARLNFASQILRVEFTTPQGTEVTEHLNSLASKIEPGVTLVDRAAPTEEKKAPRTIDLPLAKAARFLLAGAAFAAALLLTPSETGKLLLFAGAYLLSGGDVILRAVKGFFRGRFFDENVLMTVATLGAWGIRETPEAVAVMLFYQFGELFQESAVNHSRRSIKSLMNLKPDFARLIEGEISRKVAPEEVEPGQMIEIRPGERVPLDGFIIRGEAVGDTSALTGESLPRHYVPGEEILSGVICQDGLLQIEVSKHYAHSTVARVMTLVEEAADRKAPVEGFITKFAKIYTPAVFAAAALLFLIPTLLFGNGTDWFYRALVFLVISCPCALVVSIPLSLFAGIGAASHRGVLVKGGNILDALARAETVVFDKTGTLTEGKFSVDTVRPVDGISPETLLEWVARVERGSNHPLARAVQDFRPDSGAPLSFRESRGRGIEAILEEGEALAGSLSFLQEKGIRDLPDGRDNGSAGTAIHFALSGRYKGVVELRDRLKEDSPLAIQRLKALGVKKMILLTGDTAEAAAPVKQGLGIDEVRASLLPEQKVEALEELETRGSAKGALVFLGDGINDAPVLARADVGVAMGALGSDAAIEAADVVIMNDKPSRIADGITIARKTRRIVAQNIALALGIKGAVLLLGALGVATLWAAVFADVGTALLAILNTLRISLPARRIK